MITIDEKNPHYKFAKYWNAIGCPKLEFNIPPLLLWQNVIDNPLWDKENTYRIKDDRHWQLRKEWVDSDYTLPIEYQDNCGSWKTFNGNYIDLWWFQERDYRKAETKQETIMTETKELPTLVKGKKLEKVNIPISTLPECLEALSAGFVLESKSGGFHFIDGDNFAYFSDIKTLHAEFNYQPFIAVYKLVDVPWWENIQDGGVLCRSMTNYFYFKVICSDDISKSNGEVWVYGSYINQWEPVTDEWIESMKRGF